MKEQSNWFRIVGQNVQVRLFRSRRGKATAFFNAPTGAVEPLHLCPQVSEAREKGTSLRMIITLLAVATLAAPAQAYREHETVYVKYKGDVLISTGGHSADYTCHRPKSGVITRICYNTDDRYMLTGINGIYYQYCNIPPFIFADFIAASSAGRYYNQKLKGERVFDCRRIR